MLLHSPSVCGGLHAAATPGSLGQTAWHTNPETVTIWILQENCDPWASSISTIWELVRNAVSLEVPEKSKNRATCDLATPLLCIYPEKALIPNNTYTATFTAAIFTYCEPKCPLTDAWIEKMWYLYSMEHY